MLNQFSREELLIGKENLKKLQNTKVAIFGIGGVGSYVVEGLARAGVGKFILVDRDNVDVSNINRQIIATTKTIGKPKVEVAKERILEINPQAEVEIYQEFFMPTTKGILDESISYIVDAIDTVTAKIELVLRAKRLNIPIISSMGTGNKIEPTKFEVTDLYKTSVCPLAKVMRKELKNRGIKNLKVIYSKEEPIKIKNIPDEVNQEQTSKKQIPASMSFVPSVAGLIIAGEVVKDIIKGEINMNREEAYNLLKEYNKENFHIKHALTVEGVMKYFAETLGYKEEKEFWGIVGLLHDLDFERYPEKHCIKSQEIMRDRGVDEKIIRATASHGYNLTVDIEPEHEMEKVLYAVDELTGLIGAVALMRPSKSVQDLELKTVVKKYKTEKFAAGCSRKVISDGAEMLGWNLDKLIEETILAMRSCEEEINKEISNN